MTISCVCDVDDGVGVPPPPPSLNVARIGRSSSLRRRRIPVQERDGSRLCRGSFRPTLVAALLEVHDFLRRGLVAASRDIRVRPVLGKLIATMQLETTLSRALAVRPLRLRMPLAYRSCGENACPTLFASYRFPCDLGRSHPYWRASGHFIWLVIRIKDSAALKNSLSGPFPNY
jgi:hypothetical protein